MDLSTSTTALWPWIAASLAGLVGFELIRYWVAKTVKGIRHRWIARRALRGEAHAETLLERAGYTIVARQAERDYVVRIDGAGTRVVVRADLVVQDRQGRTLVAEVKTGREAPRIENSATRRQLLEYRVAFDTDAVLLVDAENDTIRTVTFPVGTTRVPTPGWSLRALITGAIVGVAGAVAIAVAASRAGIPGW